MALLIGIIAGLMIYSTLGGRNYRVEICMAFDGRKACRTVSGKTEEAALRGGKENACADIVSGVDETIRCQNSEPQSLKWLKRPE